MLYDLYHRNVKLQKRVAKTNNFTYRNIFNRLNKYIPSNGNVLDVGSATGTVSFYLGAKGLSVDGVELSNIAVRHANLNKMKLSIHNVNFINLPIEKYETKKVYKLITCFEVLEHLRNDEAVLKKLSEFMNKESVLVISVPSKNAPLYRLGFLNGFEKKVGHLRRYNVNEIKRLMNKAGLRTVKVHKSEGIVRNLMFTKKLFGILIKFTKFNVVNNLLSTLDEISVLLFGESQIILIAKKK